MLLMSLGRNRKHRNNNDNNDNNNYDINVLIKVALSDPLIVQRILPYTSIKSSNNKQRPKTIKDV